MTSNRIRIRIRRRSSRTAQSESRTGLSLVEVVVSTLLVGLVLAGAMQCLGGVLRGRTNAADAARAQHLAQQLMAEIVAQPYKDSSWLSYFGRELDELLISDGSRKRFDDVDDYVGWSSSPPEDQRGNDLPNLSGWRREATVAWVYPSDPATVSPTDRGVKRITVTVRRDGKTLATLVALRAEEYEQP